jgi:TonB family protein
MKTLIVSAGLACAALAGAQEGFVEATPVHVEPLGEIDVTPGVVFTDTVMLRLYLDAEGTVTSVEVWSSSGDEVIDAAAVEAGGKCRFLPATQDGEPVESYFQIYYRLSAYRTREYLSVEDKAGTAEEAPPPPKEDDGGN